MRGGNSPRVFILKGGCVLSHFSYRNPSHRIYTDIQPVLSALKHGKRRIANLRFQALCDQLNLMKWEASVVSELIRLACQKQNIRPY